MACGNGGGACDNGACGNGCGNACGACDNGACGNGCGNAACCPNGAACNGACGNAACCPNGNGCGNDGCGNDACCHNGNACDPGCAAPCDPGCAAPGTTCCNVDNDACCIAKLIYQSQTACYAKDRRAAIRRLSKYDCACHPEIMSAFAYALNDADERVREAAANAIAVQVRRNPCCCSACVVNALTNALADCDRGVRRAAEKALCACGYDIVNPVSQVACCDNSNGCNNCAPYAPACAPAGEPAPAAEDDVPAPAEPEEEGAFYRRPTPAPAQVTARPVSSRKSLKNLFGLTN
ncbi:MAG: HEAT repeat domain-containing protein [Planctomyces sp.]|nr:HEAT repeat domain-containing protein [Planctomyces sp.]